MQLSAVDIKTQRKVALETSLEYAILIYVFLAVNNNKDKMIISHDLTVKKMDHFYSGLGDLAQKLLLEDHSPSFSQ